MQNYLDSLKFILNNGHRHEDRTGVGRISVFGYQERYDLQRGFPLVTTRQIFTKAMVDELLWFIRGETNTKKGGCPAFWDRWSVKEQDIDSYVKSVYDITDTTSDIFKSLKSQTEDVFLNSIGPMYGAMWRNAPITQEAHRTPRTVDQLPSDKLSTYKEEYEELVFLNQEKNPMPFEEYACNRYLQTVDQLNELIINLKERPFSSRHCITAWIPEFIPPESISPQESVLRGFGCLAPCHAFFQFFVHPGKDDMPPTLDCQLYIRSSDVPIGKPYNIAQYALLQSMIAHVVGMVPGTFILTTGDMHIYANQIEQVKQQLTRVPYNRPKLWLNPEVKDLFQFMSSDIQILDYTFHPRIDYTVSV